MSVNDKLFDELVAAGDQQSAAAQGSQSINIEKSSKDPLPGSFSGNTSEGPFQSAPKPLPGTWYSDLAELQKHLHLLEARLRTLLHGNIQVQERFERLERHLQVATTNISKLQRQVELLESQMPADPQDAASPADTGCGDNSGTIRCPGCGSVVPESVPNARFGIPARSNFCNHCGQALRRDEKPQVKVYGEPPPRNPDVLREVDIDGQPQWRCAHCGYQWIKRDAADRHAATCPYNPANNAQRAR